MDWEEVPVALGGGVAAILAAAIIAAVTARRRRQRSARRYGERLPVAADGPAREIEEQLRAVIDLDALASVHRALATVLATARQTSSPLPSLFAVRVDDTDITLYLREAAELASPFVPLFTDGTAWTARRNALTTDVDPHTAAPYPALVTVGTDLDGGILLLDLEQQPHLTLHSPDDTAARSVLNAIVAELASVPWGEDIHLSLLGVPEQLAVELDPYRIHRVADTGTLIRDVRTHLADRRAALAAAGISEARTARVQLAEIEAWAPFIVVIGTCPTPDEQEALNELLHQYADAGLAIVALHGTTGTSVEIALDGTSATYQADGPTLPPLPFVPQMLDDQALADTLHIFTRATLPADPLEEVQPQPSPASIGELAPLARAADAQVEPGDTGGMPSQEQPREVTTSTTHPRHVSLSSERESTPASGNRGTAPCVHLLGQVEIEYVDRPELIPGRGVELLAYLLHHRQPTAGTQIQKALWPTSYDRTNGNARTLAKQVRAALGHDLDGHLWLPEGRGNAGFTTHPDIRSDWQDFTDLTGPDPTTAPTDRLATALRLVHGQPLLGTDGHRGRWAWRAPLEETIIASIHDAATATADRAIAGDDRALVKLAVRAARFADPYSELSWQIELRAAIARGTAAEVDRIIADLSATAGHGNPDYEPDTETLNLIHTARSVTGPPRR